MLEGVEILPGVYSFPRNQLVMPERARLLEMCIWDGESHEFQLCLGGPRGGTESDLWTGA